MRSVRLDFILNCHEKIDSSHDFLATHRSASDIIDHFANKADPSSKKVYTQWIINRYKNKDFRQEDHGRIRTALENFDQHKAKLHQKDINHYKSLSDLEDAVEPHLGTLSNKQEKSKIKHEGADLIHDGSEFMVHKLKTKEAACHYGKGTKWCTAADKDNAFDSYNKDGPLYVVTHKPTQEKHQFHFESDQFADARDKSIDLKQFVSQNPELKEVKEFREKSPYFAWNPKDFDKKMRSILSIGSSSMKQHAIQHPDATPEHISIALRDNGDWWVQRWALRHPQRNKNHTTEALLYAEDPDIRGEALDNKNVTVEHIDLALDDKDIFVRHCAIRNPNIRPSHIEKALKDKSLHIRKEAIKHLEKAMLDKNINTSEISVSLKPR